MVGRIVKKLKAWHEAYEQKKAVTALLDRLARPFGRRRILLFQTPSHSNIGDHAIAEAEMLFLKKHFPDDDIIEIHTGLHYPFLAQAKDYIAKNDVVLLHGGGNLGNEYMHEENIRRSVVRAFPNNRIVLLPQTMFYTADEIGQRELKTTKELYATHRNLTLIAREATSFELMRSSFADAKILLTPDIVLSMSMLSPSPERSGILMVLRDDEERILSSGQQKELDAIARKFSTQITYSDMHYSRCVAGQAERDEVLGFKFKQFSSSRLVITDRLHGMVFAAITGTPCIAFSNYNQKVSGTYKWIENLNYICFSNGFEGVEDEIKRLLELWEITAFEPAAYDVYFSKLIEAING